jgi:uncharacterized RDD family membrane protein YckC
VSASAGEERYAGLVTRAIAFAIDAAVIDGAAVLVFAVVALASTVLHIPKDVRTILLAIGAAAYVLWAAGYFVAFWATNGRTLGNRLMYIRVVPADGGKLGYRRAIQRFVGLVLAVLPLFLGLVGILLTERRRGFQDRLANTVVVHDPERREPRPGSGYRAAASAQDGAGGAALGAPDDPVVSK